VRTLKHIGQSIIQRLERLGVFPRALVATFQQRRQKVVLRELETERLDRIRNPSKYRGK